MITTVFVIFWGWNRKLLITSMLRVSNHTIKAALIRGPDTSSRGSARPSLSSNFYHALSISNSGDRTSPNPSTSFNTCSIIYNSFYTCPNTFSRTYARPFDGRYRGLRQRKRLYPLSPQFPHIFFQWLSPIEVIRTSFDLPACHLPSGGNTIIHFTYIGTCQFFELGKGLIGLVYATSSHSLL